MRIIKTANYDEMSARAADYIAAQVILKPNATLGLATGSTPIGAYKALVAKYNAGELDFSGVTTVNLDEYKGITHENDQSYYYFMHDNLFNHVNVPEERINVPNGLESDAAKECARYNAVIEATGGIDLQLLGIGRNGHIGFNEPCDEFVTGTHEVKLTESTIDANKRFFASEADVPRYAYTMGIQNIMSAKKVLVVASGKDKAQAIKDSFFGPVTPQVPASVLQLHPDVLLIADADALSLVNA